jgi:hypothetical protein
MINYVLASARDRSENLPPLRKSNMAGIVAYSPVAL